MDTINIESTTWLDLLPTEIIFLIFNYLSNNDIIYTFLHFNQRFNNLLLQNQHYLNYFELPSTDLNTWINIFSIMESQIEILNIKINYLSFLLRYFSNLKSLIISSPYGLPEEELKSIFENEQFQNLHSFKIKEEKILFDKSYNHIFYKDYLFGMVFNSGNSLQTLTIPSFYVTPTIPLFYAPLNTDQLKVNINFHSMTLNIIYFEMIYLIIKSTPNLEYLNVSFYKYSRDQYRRWIETPNIKLKQLDLTVRGEREISSTISQFNYCIKQISSSLICLSLNLLHLPRSSYGISFNNIELQKFLEPMKNLKEFHLYAKIGEYSINSDEILSKFQDQYCFDHNWSFGIHRNYFSTRTFHFDHLYDFCENFNDVKSNNPEILINNPRIWYHVKSIEVERSSNYNKDFVKELKMKMPKLNLSIIFVFLNAIHLQSMIKEKNLISNKIM